MTDRELVLETMRRSGKLIAADLQSRALAMTGTELIAEEDYIPDFEKAVERMNMKDRPAGFVCRYDNQVYLLDAPYDSEIHTATPDKLPSQYKLKHTKDPKKAKPFVSYDVSRSQYDMDECCIYEGHVWRSGQDTNTWAPGTINVKWEDLGTIEEVSANE